MFANLKAEAARGGWTMNELARAAGMAPSSLYQKMNGTREFRLNEMVTLREVLGCEELTLDKLFEKTEA